MADNVIVNPSASYTVAAEDIGVSVQVQRIKVVLGDTDIDGGNVAATNPMPVTGAVGVSGAVSVSAMPAVSGTVTVNTLAAGFSVNALVTGAVSISVMPAVSGTVTVIAPAVSTVGTVLGTVAVNVVAGGAAPGSTAGTQSNISGQVIWLAPTQTIQATVNTIAAGFSVNALVTGPVSVSAMPAVSISVSAVLGTVVTVLGTLAVNVVAGGAAPGSTAATQSAITAQVVWLAPTQTISATVNTLAAGFSVNALVTGPVSISALPAISISVSAVLGTIITQLGTQIVSVVPGVSVNALVTGPVSISAMPAVSISVSAVLGTIVTQLGTQVVTVALLNFTTATPTVTATGPIVWLANTVTVTVTATVTGSLIVSGVTPTAAGIASGVTGLPVWPGTPGYQAVQIIVASTAIAQSAAIYAFTIWTGATGAPAAAATTALAVPAGKTLRLLNMQAIVNSSAVTGGTVNVILLGVAATGSQVSASISTQLQVMKLQVLVSAGPIAASIAGFQDVGPGVTIGVIIAASTASVLQQLVIMGYLF